MEAAHEHHPVRIGPYEVTRTLTDGASWLARDPHGAHDRLVVIKKLEADCLLRGQLHPSIRDRLARVRELAHPGVANFLGAERAEIDPSPAGVDEAFTYLVWQYLPGQTLGEWATDAARRDGATDDLPRWLLGMAREVVAAVESLHALGIVHGGLHERNILIDEFGAVRLTHISPLLYDAPAEDAAAVFTVLRDVIRRCGQEDTTVGWALETAAGQAKADTTRHGGAGTSHMAGTHGRPTLRRLAGCLSGLVQDTAEEAVRSAVAGAKDRDEAKEIRRRALIGAAGAMVIGAIIVWGLWQQGRRTAPRPPAVQNAPPAAMSE